MTTKATPPSTNPFRAARRAGVPIIGIETSDPAATIVKCSQALNGKHEITPLIRWDVIQGPKPLNQPGANVLAALGDINGAEQPSTFLAALAAKPAALEYTPDETEPDKHIGAIIFLIHANRWLDDYGCMQSIWNCRDACEPIGATIVLLGPTIKLPVELKNDIVLISEPLPDHEELDGILTKIAKAAELKVETFSEDREAIVDTMTGTSAFGAKQILSMSVTREGIDKDILWNRKRKMIEQTPGLSVWRGGSRFEDIGGLENLKEYVTSILLSGITPIRAIGFWDEIEKSIAGASGDLSGTSQDQLMVVLKIMADYQVPGIILIGPGGTGKSEIAKAAGNVAKCPTISFDLGAMKDSLVGGSESRIRGAMDVFRAVSEDKGFFIATCNKIAALPPELRRRFKLGTFFIDLPTKEERDLIWPIHMAKCGLKKQPLPDCEGWTGAEIAACCEVAFRTGKPLKQAAAFIVPVIESAPESVEALRKLAHNRFINASKPGKYKYEQTQQLTAQSGERKIER